MKLTRNEISILKFVAKNENRTIGQIASALRVLRPSLSRTIPLLKEDGLIKITKKGISSYVAFSETKHAFLLKTILLSFEHFNFEKILSGPSIEILSHLAYSQMDKKQIASCTQLSEKTVQDAVRRFREFGIVIREKKSYRLNERFDTLEEFALEFRNYENQKIARNFAEDSIILWQRGREFLIKTSVSRQSKNFFLTSITAYHKYGIQLILRGSFYYFFSPYKRSLKIEDVILHGLVLDPTDTRLILSAMLAWKKNVKRLNIDCLMQESEKYGLKPMVDAIIDYFDSNGQNAARYFPKWDEFKSKAEEYGL